MADNSPLPQASVQKDKKLQGQQTAVIYVHGMGEQRRNEEVSRLIDCLDHYAYGENIEKNVGILEDIKAGLEENINDKSQNVTYIRVSNSKNHQPVTFYELYWAPIMSSDKSIIEVLKWLVSQVNIPIKGLRSAWRLRSRLKIAFLYSHWKSLVKHNPSYTKEHLWFVLNLYSQFEGPEARRRYSKGTSKDFEKYIQNTEKINDKKISSEIKPALIKILRQWKRFYILSEIFNLFVILTLLLALMIGYGTFLYFAALLLQWFVDRDNLSIVEYVNRNWKTVTTIAGLMIGTLGISGFLTDYLGDVQKWATYTETDQKYEQRRKVINTGVDLFKHVLNLKHILHSNDKYNRIVVVAHSLGTSVAHDVLLEIGRYNRARMDIKGAPINHPLPLYKIEHFISLATPIDKIHYFFENYKSNIHRYNRFVEKIRGDISEVPFSKNKKPQIHWINFWDAADIISGSVESSNNAKYLDLQVDNYQVYNRWFPDPGTSHHAYFDDKDVLEVLFESIFNRKYSFMTAPRNENLRPDFDAQLIGAGKGIWINRFFQVLMLILPWTFATYVVTNYFSIMQFSTITGWASLIIFIILGIGFLISRIKGHLNSYLTYQ